MRKILSFAVAGAFGLASGAAVAQTKWDLPAGYPAGNFHSQTLVKFANDIKDATAGKLLITVHPGASLFKVPEIKRAVQTGQAQIGELLMSLLDGEDAIYSADTVPFLATSYADARKLANLQKPMIEKRLAAQGMRLIYWVPWPPQGFYSPKPLSTVDDLKGLKFRSYGATAGKLGELAGMQVTTVQAAEAAQAFATGRVNSMISSGSTGYDIKIWEHLKYFYDVQAWLPKNMVFVNEAAWKKLDANTQKAVMTAAQVAEARGWAESERLATFYFDEFKKNGMTVSAPPPAALKDGFKKFGETLAADWEKRAGADGAALLKAFKAGS